MEFIEFLCGQIHSLCLWWSTYIWKECVFFFVRWWVLSLSLTLSFSPFVFVTKIVNGVIQIFFIHTCFWLFDLPISEIMFNYSFIIMNLSMSNLCPSLFVYIVWSYGPVYIKVAASYIFLVNCAFNEFGTSFFVPLNVLCLALILLHLLSFV